MKALLYVSVKTNRTVKHICFFRTLLPAPKNKRACPSHRYELNNVENFQNKTGELKQKLLNLPKLSR